MPELFNQFDENPEAKTGIPFIEFIDEEELQAYSDALLMDPQSDPVVIVDVISRYAHDEVALRSALLGYGIELGLARFPALDRDVADEFFADEPRQSRAENLLDNASLKGLWYMSVAWYGLKRAVKEHVQRPRPIGPHWRKHRGVH